MTQAVKPANQPLRIALLRWLFICLLPLMFIVEPAWADDGLLSEAFESLGALLVIGGVLGRFWSILYIGGRKNDMVMTIGPYSMCRHPLYFFSTMAVTGLGLLLGSLMLAVLFGGLTFLILMATARREEAFLRGTFGGTYDAYAARTPLIWPRPSLFHSPNDVVFSVRHLKVNTFDALVFLSFIPLAEAVDYLKEMYDLPMLMLY